MKKVYLVKNGEYKSQTEVEVVTNTECQNTNTKVCVKIKSSPSSGKSLSCVILNIQYVMKGLHTVTLKIWQPYFVKSLSFSSVLPSFESGCIKCYLMCWHFEFKASIFHWNSLATDELHQLSRSTHLCCNFVWHDLLIGICVALCGNFINRGKENAHFGSAWIKASQACFHLQRKCKTSSWKSKNSNAVLQCRSR